MEHLEKKIGYQFHNKAFLETALTHSSYANENRSKRMSNERLEFLGDSVLGMIVAHHLYLHYPEMPEGKMTRLRAELVCENSLVKVAGVLDLGVHIRFGKGEKNSGGRSRPSILADAVESILAAIYLDGGIDPARAFVEHFILNTLSKDKLYGTSDFKTALQEHVQQHGQKMIIYEMIGESGPDHMKTFTARVNVSGKVLGEGCGRSKKEAEQSAAHAALTYLKGKEL